MSDKRKNNYDQLKEEALHNFELLLWLWKIDYVKVGLHEYDFIAPHRSDNNFGACKFNIFKGRGADFSGVSFTQEDIDRAGGFSSFSAEDFSSSGSHGTYIKRGFDVIGLCERVYLLSSYREAALRLRNDIQLLHSNPIFRNPAKDAAEQRRKKLELLNKKVANYAETIWRGCARVSFAGSIGEKYLNKRGITIFDKNMRFHPQLLCRPLHTHLPGLVFKVSQEPNSELKAIHRIFLDHDGNKANLENPKMALAKIHGMGIWFGEKSETLLIGEGPENTLHDKQYYNFNLAVSTINASNYHSLTIPDYIKNIMLIPDRDKAGKEATLRAIKEYKKQNKKILIGGSKVNG